MSCLHGHDSLSCACHRALPSLKSLFCASHHTRLLHVATPFTLFTHQLGHSFSPQILWSLAKWEVLLPRHTIRACLTAWQVRGSGARQGGACGPAGAGGWRLNGLACLGLEGMSSNPCIAYRSGLTPNLEP